MIKYDYTVTVTGNTAKLDKDIYLFRGNKNVHYYFAIKNASFNFKGTTDLIEKTNAINAAVTVVKPNAVEVANAIAPVENGKIHLKVTEDLIDEEVEVGDFDLVFDLFDDTDGAVTIPKVIGQFHVLERPCTTPISELVATNTTNEVDQALTDYAIVTYAEPVASTNADGTFAKKTWVAKEKITTAELNRMEEGISDVSSQCKDIVAKIGNISIEGSTVYIGSEQPTNGALYWLDTSKNSSGGSSGGDSGGGSTGGDEWTYDNSKWIEGYMLEWGTGEKIEADTSQPNYTHTYLYDEFIPVYGKSTITFTNNAISEASATRFAGVAWYDENKNFKKWGNIYICKTEEITINSAYHYARYCTWSQSVIEMDYNIEVI